MTAPNTTPALRRSYDLVTREHNTNSPVPCLNNNNCTDKLSSYHQKVAFALEHNVMLLCNRFGLTNIGFLTLTFKDNVQCIKEAQARLHSLTTHVLKKRYQQFITIVERQQTGRIHFHLILALNDDIRTGFNFDEARRRRYCSANGALKAEWRFWRQVTVKYRFGRHELLPVRTTAEAVAKYVGKFVGSNIRHRRAEDKGARLVRYSWGARSVSTRFAWNSKGARQWRQKLSVFAQATKISTYDGFYLRFGRGWAYRLKHYIMATPTAA
jgi:hypothetical protein